MRERAERCVELERGSGRQSLAGRSFEIDLRVSPDVLQTLRTAFDCSNLYDFTQSTAPANFRSMSKAEARATGRACPEAKTSSTVAKAVLDLTALLPPFPSKA